LSVERYSRTNVRQFTQAIRREGGAHRDSGFPGTPYWQSMRERFMPPLVIERLPHSLLERFEGESMWDRLSQALRWIAPLSLQMPIR
jgi:hypothetical protein